METQPTISPDSLESNTTAPVGSQPEEPAITLDGLHDDSTLRFSGAPWYNEIIKYRSTLKYAAIVGGVGGIGSFLAFFLSRAQIDLYAFDFDTVEPVNLAGQLFSESDLYKSKIEAVSSFLKKYNPGGPAFIGRTERLTSDNYPRVVLNAFSCFDNMEARKTMFESWKLYNGRAAESSTIPSNNDPFVPIFIDGRLSAEGYQIFCIPANNANRIREYEAKYLFKDTEADAVVCSYKQTTYMASIIAAKMAMYFINQICNSIPNTFPRVVPFIDEFDNNEFYSKITM